MKLSQVLLLLKARSIKHLTKPDLYEKDVKLLIPVRRPVNVFLLNTLVFKEVEELSRKTSRNDNLLSIYFSIVNLMLLCLLLIFFLIFFLFV